MLREVWFGFGLDPIAEKLVAITVTKTKEEAEKHCRERLQACEEVGAADIISTGVFNLMNRDGVWKLRKWLVDCKVPRDHLPNLMKQIAETIAEIHHGKRDRP